MITHRDKVTLEVALHYHVEQSEEYTETSKTLPTGNKAVDDIISHARRMAAQHEAIAQALARVLMGTHEQPLVQHVEDCATGALVAVPIDRPCQGDARHLSQIAAQVLGVSARA